jgi:hypothetical protein
MLRHFAVSGPISSTSYGTGTWGNIASQHFTTTRPNLRGNFVVVAISYGSCYNAISSEVRGWRAFTSPVIPHREMIRFLRCLSAEKPKQAAIIAARRRGGTWFDVIHGVVVVC